MLQISISYKKCILAEILATVQIVYSVLVHIAWWFLKLIAYFKPKIRLFVDGRKNVFFKLQNSFTTNDTVIWMHVASLGEYEQGLPILQKLKSLHPEYKILLTFFSPSGYEIKKNSSAADVTVYLPLDTISNAKRLIKLVNPKIALFIKYEIWPNYLNELRKKKIPTFLVSAIFSKKQVYFKWYGSFMRKSLNVFHYIFVQDKNSQELLNIINIKNVSISGDTRFDRVSEILNRDNTLTFMTNFKQNKYCFVAGSSWPDDEEILINFINTSNEKIKYVIAPHNIKKEHIKNTKNTILKKTILYSEIANKNIADFDVLLIDTIGLLTKIFSYADIAYIGGGFKTGLHNTLEPAVYGIPIITGPNFQGFKEAEDLVQKKGLFPIKSKANFAVILKKLLEAKDLASTTGKINATYVKENTGATTKIINYLEKVL